MLYKKSNVGFYSPEAYAVISMFEVRKWNYMAMKKRLTKICINTARSMFYNNRHRRRQYSYIVPCVGDLNAGRFCSVENVTFAGWV